MKETQIKLAEELVEVCRDYCLVTWAETRNLAGVPADLEWRQPEKVYFHLEIREVSVAFLSPSATTPESSK